MSSKDPILKLVQLTESLWSEKKALNHIGKIGTSETKRQIARIEKIIIEIKFLQPDLLAECDFLREIYKIKK